MGQAGRAHGASPSITLLSRTDVATKMLRQAHHMFYTAVKDHPCYAGYLWAPFDALLNVPRLMQFPQDHIWYHSPFTQRYVPNPALPLNSTAHAPPAMISERTPREYSDEMNAWGASWAGWYVHFVHLFSDLTDSRAFISGGGKLCFLRC